MADLGRIFDEHVASEFVTKDLDVTMNTMVDEPYVWHVPPLTGASGGDAVRRFYSQQFIGHTPDDAVLTPISRTVSTDRVIDEFVLEFTHDIELPWMLPGVAPTNRRVRIPTVVVMGFDGDKVAYEHLLGPSVGAGPDRALGSRRLPIAGAAQADRLLALAGASPKP
jgi:carboxymethylenebutenolidase